MDLILFTNFFPTNKAEPFLVNEYNFTKQHFNSIKILPLYGDLKDSILKSDEKSQTFQPIFKSHTLKKTLFLRGLLNFSAIDFHFKHFFKDKVYLSAKKTYWFFVSLLMTRSVTSSKQYKLLLNQIDSLNQVVLYFYWGNNLCWIVPYLKRDLKNKNVKVIIRFHSTDLYENLKGDYAPLRKEIFDLANFILPISENGKEYLSKKYSFVKEKISFSRLGVFDSGLNPHTPNIVKRVVSVSSFLRVKRVDLIFQVLQQCKTKIEWHHFGDGPEFENLKNIITKHRSDLDIKLHGFVENTKIIEFYKTHSVDLFINLSEAEGIPVSIMEAFSFGIPVIATDVGGTSEIVTEKTGCLIKTNYLLSEVSNKIDQQLNLKPTESNQLRDQARIVFEEKFSAEKNYLSFYSEIIKSVTTD